MSSSKTSTMEMTHRGGSEAEGLLRERNGANIVNLHNRKSGEVPHEKMPFLHNEPVRLTPAWEGSNLPNDTLNLKGVGMELAPPIDKYRLIFLTMLIHGIGTLVPWNMFITAKDYFVDHKLHSEKELAGNFLFYLGLASQLPNFLFNWLNVFVQMGGNLTTRIVWSLSIEVLVFVFTVILAMMNSEDWTTTFFWLTIISVVILNVCNGIFQNTVYGVAARLPPTYTGAVVLGSNISGTLATLLGMLAKAVAPDTRTAAVYYFITGLLILLACFDTYFALPLNRYYRYQEQLQSKASTSLNTRGTSRPPYGRIAAQCWVQLLNIFLVFFGTLAIFPVVHSDVSATDPNFPMSRDNFRQVTCFLTFNFTAMLGNLTASCVQWPSRRFLLIFTTLRLGFIPMFLLFNYHPLNIARQLPVLLTNDWFYWAMSAVFGWSSGHGSSLGMMYVSQGVEPAYASTAGMLGAAMLITGLVAGIFFSSLCPIVVGSTTIGAFLNGTLYGATT